MRRLVRRSRGVLYALTLLAAALIVCGCGDALDQDEVSDPSSTETTALAEEAVGDGAWLPFAGTGSGPSARGGHAMVYDPSGSRILLFGGDYPGEDGYPAMLGDTWAYDLQDETWSELQPEGDSPAGRKSQAMAYVPSSSTIVMFGGMSGQEHGYEPLADTWAYDCSTDTWTELHPEGEVPSARASHTMIYDESSESIFLVGGARPEGELDDVWTFDLEECVWTETEVGGDRPVARGGFAGVYDSDEGWMFLFGGRTTVFHGDTWALDPMTGTWTELSTSGESPADRAFHSMAYVPGSEGVIMFGGGADRGVYDDTWLYDPSSDTWTELDPEIDRPSARAFHSMVYVPEWGEIVMFGGVGPDGYLGDTWVYAPGTLVFEGLVPEEAL